MKHLVVLLLFTTLITTAQVGQESEVRLSIDPVVLLNETNFNVKLEYETGTYGNNRHRISIGVEILTGHNFYAASVGYGYHIPYKIGNLDLSIQPSINIGIILREFNGEMYKSSNHFWSLRHHIAIGEYWGVYIKNRLITRPDVQYQVSYKTPYYSIDNAIGIYIKL